MGYTLPPILVDYLQTLPKRNVAKQEGIGVMSNGEKQQSFFKKFWNAPLVDFDDDFFGEPDTGDTEPDGDESEPKRKRGRPRKSAGGEAESTTGSAQETGSALRLEKPAERQTLSASAPTLTAPTVSTPAGNIGGNGENLLGATGSPGVSAGTQQ